MLRNYILVSLRNLLRNRSYSSINIVGLAIGLACFVVIYLFIQDELSYDGFHARADRIYRIAGEYDQGGDQRNRSALTTYLLKPRLDTAFPSLKKVVRIDPASGLVKHGDIAFQEDKLLFADEQFFELFTFGLVRGNSATALQGPNLAVISQSTAEKYFASENPVGETLDLDGNLIEISGVMEDMPPNAHFHADFVISMKTAEPLYPQWVLENATGTSHYTYIELPEGYSPQQFEADFAEHIESTTNPRFAETRDYFLQPLRSIHLHSHLSSEIEANGDITYVYILGAVGIVILFMACINYMSLAIARMTHRSKEVGIRKVVGARRKQLVLQFLGESILTAFLGFLFAIVLIETLSPFLKDLSGKELNLLTPENILFLIGLMALTGVIGGLSGSYPAFLLSNFPSVRSLKGILVKGKDKTFSIRRGLVIAQLTLSIALLTCTLIIADQLRYMQNKKLGISPELVLAMPFQTEEIANQFEAIKGELLRNPQIVSIAASNQPLTSRVGHWRPYRLKDMPEEVMVPTLIVTHDFFKTLEGTIVQGRDFTKKIQTDVSEAYILNESAVDFLELESPIGEPLKGSIFNGSEWGLKEARIIGVVKDFHMASLHSEIQPTVFSLHSSKTVPISWMSIKVLSGDLTATLSSIEETWNEFAPGRPISYSFMNDDLNQLYQSEKRFLGIFLTFAVLAITISCLGVFGVSAFIASQRTKEIGIRKVLGASVPKIVGLLSFDLIRSVIIANIVAWPIAYLVMERWLQDFAYRTNIGLSTFALAGALALSIAFLTISYKVIRAAFANPVESLRYE